MYDSSTAYDYSSYTQEEIEEEKNARELLREKLELKKHIAKTVKLVQITMGVMFVASLCFVTVLLRAQQAQVHTEYQNIVNEINTLNKENNIYQMEIEQKFSLDNIDKIATDELGMSKVDVNNIEYYSFVEEDKAEVVDEINIFTFVKNWLMDLFL